MSLDRRALTGHRTPLRLLLAVLLAGAFAALTLAPAQAAAYRYWGFYQLTDSKWAFAQKGPDQTVPADGSVEGWRFAVGDEQSTRLPRAVLTFDELCGTTPAAAGQKRVGLVVDFGRAADAADASTTPPAPTASCATVPTDGTSTDVLAKAGTLRIEKGLVCAVAGYPTTDCGGEVKSVSAEAKAADTPVTIAAPSAATSTAATSTAATTSATTAPASPDTAAPATQAASSNTGTVVAYVVAAIALLALIAYLVLRSRRRAGSPS
ncbi:MAG: SCO2322 family protein [Humibacillus sp.]